MGENLYLTLKEAANKNFVMLLNGYYNRAFENYDMDSFHMHNRIELMYVEEGECDIYITSGSNKDESNIKKINIPSGVGVLLDSDTWHKLVVNDKCKIINHEYLLKEKSDNFNTLNELCLNSKEVSLFFLKFNHYTLFNENDQIKWLLYQMIEEADSSKELSDKSNTLIMYANLLLVEIIHSIAINKAFSSYEIHVKKAIQYINNHVKERIKSEDLSEYVGVSYAHLEGLFKKRVGLSLGEYIAKQKCIVAERLLTPSSQRIADISKIVQFGSRQQFCTVFRKFYGLSKRPCIN